MRYGKSKNLEVRRVEIKNNISDTLDYKEFSKMLELRTRKFAISIIKRSFLLPYTFEGKVARTQITNSGFSIGANYEKQIEQ